MPERTHIPWGPYFLAWYWCRYKGWEKDFCYLPAMKDAADASGFWRICKCECKRISILMLCYISIFLPIPQQAPAWCLVFFWTALEVWPRFSHWLLCWMLTRLLLQTWTTISKWSNFSSWRLTQNSLPGHFVALRKTPLQWDWVGAPQWLFSSLPQCWQPEIDQVRIGSSTV